MKDVFDTIRQYNQVSEDLEPLLRTVRTGVMVFFLGGALNIMALIMFYLHVSSNPSLIIIRFVLSLVGIILLRTAYVQIATLKKKYKAP